MNTGRENFSKLLLNWGGRTKKSSHILIFFFSNFCMHRMSNVNITFHARGYLPHIASFFFSISMEDFDVFFFGFSVSISLLISIMFIFYLYFISLVFISPSSMWVFYFISSSICFLFWLAAVDYDWSSSDLFLSLPARLIVPNLE